MPELRSGRPWVTEEMMDAQPEVLSRLPEALGERVGEAARVIEAALADGRPVTVCGCGTSEHAALGVASCLEAAAVGPARALVAARPAFSAALSPREGVLVAVSHEGGTRATLRAMAAARQAAGARVVAITAVADAAVAGEADLALVTPLRDRSWCHTVAYTGALGVGALLAAALAGSRAAALPDPRGAAAAVIGDALAAARAQAAEPAGRLADRRVVLCAGAGADHVTARELGLKLSEGARLPTVALELETVVHGQLAGHDSNDGLAIVALEGGEDALVATRAAHVAAAARAIGMTVVGVLSEGAAAQLAPELTDGGRIVLPAAAAAGPFGALLQGAGALQGLTIALAARREVNPDLIRREEAPYRAAAAAAEEARW